MDKARKAEIIAKFGRHEGDTGSAEVQIALLTEINPINATTKSNSIKEKPQDLYALFDILKRV